MTTTYPTCRRLNRYGDRIASRWAFHSIVVPVTGADRRRAKKERSA